MRYFLVCGMIVLVVLAARLARSGGNDPGLGLTAKGGNLPKVQVCEPEPEGGEPGGPGG